MRRRKAPAVAAAGDLCPECGAGMITDVVTVENNDTEKVVCKDSYCPSCGNQIRNYYSFRKEQVRLFEL